MSVWQFIGQLEDHLLPLFCRACTRLEILKHHWRKQTGSSEEPSDMLTNSFICFSCSVIWEDWLGFHTTTLLLSKKNKSKFANLISGIKQKKKNCLTKVLQAFFFKKNPFACFRNPGRSSGTGNGCNYTGSSATLRISLKNKQQHVSIFSMPLFQQPWGRPCTLDISFTTVMLIIPWILCASKHGVLAKENIQKHIW